MKTCDIKAGQKYIRIDPITKTQTIYLGIVKEAYNPDRIVNRDLIIISSEFPHLVGQTVRKFGDKYGRREFWNELQEYNKDVTI